MNVLKHSLGTVMYALSQWLMLFLITKTLGLESAGIYALYLSLLTPLSILTNYGLRNFIAADVKYEFSDSSYLSLRYFSIFIFVLCGFIISFFITHKYLYLTVLLIKMFDSLSELIYGNWNRNRTIYHYTYSQFLRLVIFIVFAFILFLFDIEESNLILLFPFSMFLTYIIYDLKHSNMHFSYLKYKIEAVYRLAIKAAPLAIGSLVVSLNVLVTRYGIDNNLGSKDLAKYVYLQYYFTVASILVLSLSQISIPTLAKSNRSQEVIIIKKWSIYLTIYSFLFCVFIMFFSNIFSQLIYSETLSYPLNQRLALGMAGFFSFLSVYGNAILVSRKKLNYILLVNLSTLLLTSILIKPLINTFGLSGAFYTFLVVSFFMCLFTWYFVYGTKKLNDED